MVVVYIIVNFIDLELYVFTMYVKSRSEMNRPLNVRPKILTLRRSVFLWQNIALYLN